MRNSKVKAVLLLCAMLISIAVTGCADTSWAVQVDSVKVPAGVYISFLYINRESVLSKASGSSSGSSSSSSSTNAITAGESTLGSGSSSSSSSVDPWSQKIEGQTASTWAINNALKSAEELAITEKLCAQKNIKLTSDETSSLESYASQFMSTYTGFKSNGVSSSSLQRMLGYSSFLLPKLLDAYYGKSGTQPVSDADLSKYYSANYADIRQIFFNTNDDSGNALSSSEQTKIKAQADSVFSELNADKSKFDTLLSKYNQDPGMTQNPGGYIFNKDNTEYYQIFVDTAFDMKVGDVRLIQSDAGWHIMYRVPTDPAASSFDTTMKEEVLQNMKHDDMMKVIDDALKNAKVTKNTHTLNRYNPKNLKDS